MAQAVGVVSIIATVASTAMSVVSSIQQQNAAAKQASAMEAQAQRQAEAARLQARLSEANAGKEAANLQVEAQRTRSRQVTAGASAGVNLGSSSLLDIMDETADLYEKDRQQILSTGALQSGAQQFSASGYDASASYYSSYQPSYLGAAATGLAGIGQAANQGETFYNTYYGSA